MKHKDLIFVIVLELIVIVVLIGILTISEKINYGTSHQTTLTDDLLACRGSKVNKVVYVGGKVDCMPYREGNRVLLTWEGDN